MSEYFTSGNRKVTSNSFCRAIDFNGKPMSFRTETGKLEPIMMGVTEFGLFDQEEFFKGENHIQTKKTGARFIIWLPNAKGHNKGIAIDGKMYLEAQREPEKWPDRVMRLAEYGVGMDIDCR